MIYCWLATDCPTSPEEFLARYAVPRYGAVRVLFYEIAGGTVILATLLPLLGRTPVPPGTLPGWLYIAGLGIGAVLGANFFYFAAVRRIDAAPTAVAASIEPVVGALLALLLFDQQLTASGWLGLALVVGSALPDLVYVAGCCEPPQTYGHTWWGTLAIVPVGLLLSWLLRWLAPTT